MQAGFKQLIEDMNEFFITLDHRLCFTYANRKFLREMEYSQSELLGRPLALVVSPRLECETAYHLDTVMQEQAPGQCLSRFYSRSGRAFDVRAMASPLLENGQAVGLSIVAEDVTEYESQARALAWRKQRMDAIADCMLEVMIRLDTDFNITYSTPSVKRMAGYEPDLLLGMSLFTLVHPEDRQLVREAAQESIALEEARSRQIRFRHQDGHYIWMEATGNPLVDESGQHNGFIISSRDVTARVQYEKELIASRRNLESLFASMQEGFGLWKLVRGKKGQFKDLRCLDVNAAFLKSTGHQRENLLGQLNSRVYPRLDEDWMETFMEVVNSGKPRSFEGYSRQTGRYYEIYAFRPGKDQLACMFVDATRRITTEKQLAEDRNWLQVVLGSVNEGIVATDVGGKVLFLNQKAAALMGWEQEEAVGQNLSHLFSSVETIVPGQDQPDEGEKLTLADNTIVINRSGTRSIISNSSAPIYDTEGNNLGMVMVLSDITEQSLAREKIEYLSFNDVLTGLHNRAYVEHLTSAYVMDPRQLPLTIILGDVNGLKLTNDVFGHLEGDRLLRKTAGILKECCRDTDVIARWGGDEFLIMLPCSDALAAETVCSRIRRHCHAAGQNPIEISISLGHATRSSLEENINDTFRRAEDRMYETKMQEKTHCREAIIASLERNLWTRSFESPEHNLRVQELALAIARDLGLKGAELDQLALLASLHDIGKIGVDSELLARKGPLSYEESEQLRKHSEIGYRMAGAIPELKPIAESIWCSHEAWDGSGYPRGLQGEDIPLMSRIINLVHSYDVIAHGVYKPALGEEEARQRILEGRGGKYEPRLVDVMLKLLDRQEAG